jgi:hypothetical protein
VPVPNSKRYLFRTQALDIAFLLAAPGLFESLFYLSLLEFTLPITQKNSQSGAMRAKLAHIIGARSD